MDQVQVGLIGANSEDGWSARSHLPALAVLDQLELVAVATSRIETARATADRYGVRRAYANADELIADPDVELVVVTVRIAKHYALVRAALEAGKDVLCEWPLACGTEEAQELLELAQRLDRRHFIGLQASVSPEVRYARELIDQGEIGTVEAVTVRAAAALGGRSLPANYRYLLGAEVQTSHLSIQVAHTVAGVTRLVGNLESASGLTRTRHPQVELSGTGEMVETAYSDHVAILASSADNVLVTLNIATGVPQNPGTTIEVTGSTGTLRLESVGPLQYTDLRLLTSTGAGSPVEHEPPYPHRRAPGSLTDRAAVGVAELYLAVADDLRGPTHATPTFADAVDTHRLLEATGVIPTQA